MSNISAILFSLTSNQSWYTEVFDDTIVEKWRAEAKDLDLFLLAIRILRTTAQRVYHSPTCEWTPYHCRECNSKFLEEEKNNYRNYGYYTYRDPCFANLDAECEHERCSCVSPCNSLLDYVEYKENLTTQDSLKELAARLRIDSGRYLPSEVRVEGDEAHFESPITNFQGDVTVLEQALSSFLPSLRKVLRRDNLTKLQVIVKLSSTEGEKEWHSEGLPRERIVATCVHTTLLSLRFSRALEGIH